MEVPTLAGWGSMGWRYWIFKKHIQLSEVRPSGCSMFNIWKQEIEFFSRWPVYFSTKNGGIFLWIFISGLSGLALLGSSINALPNQGWHVPSSTKTNPETWLFWCNFATWPEKFQQKSFATWPLGRRKTYYSLCQELQEPLSIRKWFRVFLLIFFVCYLICRHLGRGENAIHFVNSCHQRAKTVCLFALFVFQWMSLRVTKSWSNGCADASSFQISRFRHLDLSKIQGLRYIVAFAQSRHEELSPKTHITIDIFILWIVISSSILNSWKVILIIVLQVGNVICIFKTSLRSRGRPHGDQRFVRLKITKQREETETVQQCHKIQHGFYPLKKGAPSQLKLDFGQVAPIVRWSDSEWLLSVPCRNR